MNEEAIRKEIERRKNVFRRAQANLPFAEKVRIAFELSKLRLAIDQARRRHLKESDPPATSSTQEL